MKISWLALYSPKTGTDRLCTWIGDSVQIVVTGLDGMDLGNAPMSFDLPESTKVHGVPDGADGRGLARELGGALFTVYRRDAIELLIDAVSTPRLFVRVTPEQAEAHRRILDQYPDGVIPLNGKPPEDA